jgi:hypothetical protein
LAKAKKLLFVGIAHKQEQITKKPAALTKLPRITVGAKTYLWPLFLKGHTQQKQINNRLDNNKTQLVIFQKKRTPITLREFKYTCKSYYNFFGLAIGETKWL